LNPSPNDLSTAETVPLFCGLFFVAVKQKPETYYFRLLLAFLDKKDALALSEKILQLT